MKILVIGLPAPCAARSPGLDGSDATPAARVAEAYLRAVRGPESGEVIEPRAPESATKK